MMENKVGRAQRGNACKSNQHVFVIIRNCLTRRTHDSASATNHHVNGMSWNACRRAAHNDVDCRTLAIQAAYG